MTKRFESVWMYVDPVASPSAALDAAIDAAHRSGAPLLLVAAIGRGEDRIFQTSFGLEIMQMVRADREARLGELERLARAALASGQVESVLLEGEVPWHSVIAHAAEHQPGVLIVPARVGGKTTFDSVTQHYFRKCPVPVWSVVGARCSPRRVLAAVDPGPPGSEQRALAREVMELPFQLGAGEEIEVHVAHAWSLLGEAAVRARLGAGKAEEFRDRTRQQAEAELEELLASADVGAVAAKHLPGGAPDLEIPELARRLDVDLVVLGTAARTGLAGFLIGSTAEGILARLDRSALVVKPPGFVSPVVPRARSQRRRDRA